MREKKTDSNTAYSMGKDGIKSRIRFAARMLAMIVATGFLCACGGGGDDSTSSTDNPSETISALTMPDRISITSVDDSDTSRSIKASSVSKAGLLRAYDDAGTDYDNQTKNVWVEDTDALDMVNDILAVVQETDYENYVNEEPYKALVKKVGDSEESASGTSTTATTTEELMEITVQVTRESNTSPMIVKVWVLEEDGPGGAAMLIRGYFSVSEGVSADYPYGQMEAHFVGVKLDESGAETDTEVMWMAIRVDADDDGNVVVQCVDEGQEGDENTTEAYSWNNRFRLVSNSDLSEGQAYVNSSESWRHGSDSGTDDYEGYIAYNDSYFKVQASDSTDPTVYDKNSLHRKVYRYKLFDADTGDKVSRNGGFPITLESGAYGYIGYWGLWANNGEVIENGDTVTDMDGNEYTVFSVAGKLRKHTKTQVTLGELTDVEMSMWDSTEGADYIIAWNGAQFNKIGLRNNQTGQVEYGDYGVAAFANEWDGAWCESLNAYMNLGWLYADGMPAVTDSTTFSFHTEETVDPSTAEDLTLYYWGPVVGQTHEEYWMSNPTEATVLNFDAASLMLEYQNQALVDTENASWMSPMTTTEYTQGNQWQANDADEYYSWSTGPNEWDQYTTLKNASNEFVSFDKPLRFSYVHSTANDLNDVSTLDGMTFNLDYDGTELHVPWNYDPELNEWQPMFSLKDGAELIDSLGDSYVVKGIEVGVVMREAQDPSLAADLLIDDTIAAPTLTFDSTKTDLVGDRPTATLKVIKGETI